jgi:hypothetical protein
MKTCTKCGQEKPLTEFYTDKRISDGRTSRCKECLKKKNKKYCKKWYEANKDKVKKHYQDNKEKLSERRKQYYQDNKEKAKQYYQDNKNNILERSKRYRQDNKERLNEYNRKYHQNNKEKINERNKQYLKQKRTNDPLYKIKHNLRVLIGNSIRFQGYSKNSKTFEILGCSFEYLMNWLDFEKWNNEDCHIDHIIPISLAKNEDEVLLLNHYTNLQILSAQDNIKKGNRNVKFENLIKVVNNHPEPTKITEILNNSSIDLL